MEVPVHNIQDTWNDSGTDYDGIRIDISDTASGPGSHGLQVRKDGQRLFGVDKTGIIKMHQGLWLRNVNKRIDKSIDQGVTWSPLAAIGGSPTPPLVAPLEPSVERIERFAQVAGLQQPELVALKRWCAAMQQSGLWSKLIWVYPMIGGTALSHSIELLNPLADTTRSQLNYVGTMSHAATGMKSGAIGSAAFIRNSQIAAHNTGISYYAAGATNDGYTISDSIIGHRDNRAPTSSGGNISTPTDVSIFRSATGQVYAVYLFNQLPGTQEPIGGTSAGHSGDGMYTVMRKDAYGDATVSIYHDGVQIESAVIPIALENSRLDDFYIGNPRGDNDTEWKFVCHHYAMTDAELVVFNSHLRAFQTELGRNHGTSESYSVTPLAIKEPPREGFTVTTLGAPPWPAHDGAKLMYDGGALYLIGGWLLPFEVYRSSDLGVTWNKIATPTGISSRHAFGCCKHKGQVVVIGGDFTIPTKDIWVSDDYVTWTRLPDGPWSIRSLHSAISYNDRVYVVSGHADNEASSSINEVWASDDLIDWEKIADGTLPADATGAVNGNTIVLSDRVLIIAPFKHSHLLADRVTSRNVYSTTNMVDWIKVGEVPDFKDYRDFVTDGQRIYGFGGVDSWQGGNEKAGNANCMIYSDDFGATWIPVHLAHAANDWIGHHASALAATPAGLIVASGNGDYETGVRVYQVAPSPIY